MEKIKNNATSNIKLISSLIVMFAYGTLFILIGYTQAGLLELLFDDYSSQMVYLATSQTIGMIIGSIISIKLIRKLNIKYIIFSGMMVSALMLILISELNHMSSNKTILITLFLLFSFIMGMGISSASAVVLSYISKVYKSKKRMKVLSVSNGLFGLGGGFIPLFGAKIIVNLDKNGFEEMKYFYYIAIVVAILGAIAGLFINFKNDEINKNDQLNSKNVNNSIIRKPLIISSVLIAMYIIGTVIMNYMFVDISTVALGDSKKFLVKVIQAFGLYLIVLGFWRIISGLWITPRVKIKNFILFSAIFMVIGFIFIISGILSSIHMVYFVAVIFGIGIGNLWPLLLAYTVNIDEKKAAGLSIYVSAFTMSSIFVSQVFIATLWSFHSAHLEEWEFQNAPIILGLLAVIILIAVLLLTSSYYKKIVKKNNG